MARGMESEEVVQSEYRTETRAIGSNSDTNSFAEGICFGRLDEYSGVVRSKVDVADKEGCVRVKFSFVRRGVFRYSQKTKKGKHEGGPQHNLIFV